MFRFRHRHPSPGGSEEGDARMFMLVRLYAYRDQTRHDLGEFATVEIRNDGDGARVVGHPGSYVLLHSPDAGVTWDDYDGNRFDRFETTTVGEGRIGDG